jgi:hypothetical protein
MLIRLINKQLINIIHINVDYHYKYTIKWCSSRVLLRVLCYVCVTCVTCVTQTREEQLTL